MSPPAATLPRAVACSTVIQAIGHYRPAPGRVVLPDIGCDFIVCDGEMLVSGPMTRARESAYVGRDVILLKLDPLRASCLLGIALSELTDRVVPLTDVNRPLARALERAVEGHRPPKFVGRAADDATAEPRFARAASALRDGARVRDAAALAGLGERQLERSFDRHAGLSPATFTRIVRFRRAVGAAKHGAPLAFTAAASGYADQSHFAREVRAFTGLTARELLPHVGSVQDIVAGHF